MKSLIGFIYYRFLDSQMVVYEGDKVYGGWGKTRETIKKGKRKLNSK